MQQHQFRAAAWNPEVREITSVGIPTVKMAANMPEYAPIFVIFFENNPQMYGPIKQPDTSPQENDIRLTIIEIF